MPAMLVLKQTPNGLKLLPLTEVVGDRGRRMEGSHPQANRVREVMNYIMVKVRPMVHLGKRPTLTEVWAAIIAQYGEDFFSDVKLLPSVRNTPARLLFKETN